NRNANVTSATLASAYPPVMELMTALAVSIVVGYGAYLEINGQASIGVIVSFVTYVLQLFVPIQQIGQFLTLAQSRLAAAEHIFLCSDQPVVLHDREGTLPIPNVIGRVEFQGVSFAYDDALVLRDVDLVAEPGQTVALVGPTGAGKTTIVSLVARFYDVT